MKCCILSRDGSHADFPSGPLSFRLFDGSWYVTHTGLLGPARRRKCCGIHVEAVDSLCNSAANRFVLKATVYPSKNSSGFVGYGDADPSNVSFLFHGAEMRVAETRAVNRALRTAHAQSADQDYGRSTGRMTSSLTSMLSVIWTVAAACWSGRTVRAAIPKNSTDCLLWVHSSSLFVDHGHCGHG